MKTERNYVIVWIAISILVIVVSSAWHLITKQSEANEAAMPAQTSAPESKSTNRVTNEAAMPAETNAPAPAAPNTNSKRVTVEYRARPVIKQ